MKTQSDHITLYAVLLVTALIAFGCASPNESNSLSAQPPIAGTFPPTKQIQAAMTPQQALAELKSGNERFVSGHPRVREPLAAVKTSASGQYPYAVVLSCVDSRQPSELVLDQGIGDMFSARVAGNVLDDSLLGSMEFACKVAGAKLIAVIGHSSCGAIKGAVDKVELGHLSSLLARIQPAVEEVSGNNPSPNSNDPKFVDKVAEANVHLVMKQIRERSPILREMLDQGQIGLAGGMYDLSTGRIRFFDQ